MKVLRYEAHAVMGIKDVKFDLQGHHLFLVGGDNAQGKTSALTALKMALCGRSGCDFPEVALREGEDKGWVKVDLSGDSELHDELGFTVELFLRRKRNGTVVEEFRVLDSSGDESPEPRKTLQRLYNLRAFDPLAFEKMDKYAKRNTLKEVLGLDFDKENAEYVEKYRERAAVNKEGVALKARFEAMKHHADAPKAEVSTSDLLTELESRQKVNAGIQAAASSLAELNGTRKDLAGEIEFTANEIDALEKKLAAMKEKYAKSCKDAENLDTEIQQNTAAYMQLEVLDLDEIRDKIKSADADNAKFRQNRERASTEKKLTELRKQSEELTSAMTRITDEQKQKLANAAWPVEGLGFDEQGVTLHNLPFEQASQKERTEVSFRIGMAMNPKLRLLICEDGGALGNAALDALDALLKKHDFQAIVELVTRSEQDEARCAVVIQDGETVEE